jgi:hypothetical protein
LQWRRGANGVSCACSSAWWKRVAVASGLNVYGFLNY